MIVRRVFVVALEILWFFAVTPAIAAEFSPVRQESNAGITHSLLITGSTGTYLFDEASTLVWEVQGYSRDGYVLENGNVLLSIDNTSGREA